MSTKSEKSASKPEIVTSGTPMASDKVNVQWFNPTMGHWESRPAPESEPPLRLELWKRSAAVDQPVRDEEGRPIVYPADIDGLRMAHAHLDALDEYDPSAPYKYVHFIKAVTAQDEYGNATRYTYRVRLVEVPVKDANGLPVIDPATGSEAVRIFENKDERQALRELGEIQKQRRNANAKQRNWLRQAEYTMWRAKATK